MKKTDFFVFVFIFFTLQPNLHAQLIAGWEETMLAENGFVKNAGQAGAFYSGAIQVDNIYVDDPVFPYWSGWILSRGTDVVTPGFTNEHSAIPGKGSDQTDQYVVTYIFEESIIKFADYDKKRSFRRMSVANSTYAYLSMKNGDGFAKKFGGESGSDPDFFRLVVRGYQQGLLGADSLIVTLADYTFSDNSKDYIASEWLSVDLSSFSNADSLSLSLRSSDVSSFGINTPTYVCVDGIEYDEASNLDNGEEKSGQIVLSQNGLQLGIHAPASGTGFIATASGSIVASFRVEGGMQLEDVSFLNEGMYLVGVNGSVLPWLFVK